jgi:hypothetical protein
MQNTPFDNLIGSFQGRIQPQRAVAANGTFVWTMGLDLNERAEVMEFGDYMQIEQTIDVTDITFLKSQIWIKQPKNLDKRSVITGLEIVALTSSTIATAVPGAPVRLTTLDKHYLVTGDVVTIAGALGTININGTFTITVIDPITFDLDDVEASGTYVANSGSIGKGERLYLPAGWTLDEYQRLVDISGSIFGDNNGVYRLLGFQAQPGVDPPKLAWVERPNVGVLTPDDVATSTGLAAVARGTRWKVSLLIDAGSGFKERARVVQKFTQSGFFRTDLSAYIRRLTGVHTFAIRLTLIEHEPTNIYDLPVQP